jgi:hypothetical protein
MSPLWSDLALARAALADAVERGLVDEKSSKLNPGETKRPLLKRVRRIPRRRQPIYAL